jgi:hypothetical protein
MVNKAWGAECFFCGYCYIEFLEEESIEDLMDEGTCKQMQVFYQASKRVTFVADTQDRWAEEKRRRKLLRRK